VSLHVLFLCPKAWPYPVVQLTMKPDLIAEVKLAFKQRVLTLEAKINFQVFLCDVERQATSKHYIRKLFWCNLKQTSLCSYFAFRNT
jgi:hypothetical protein